MESAGLELEIETLGGALLLPIQHVLLGLLEVLIAHFHATLTQRQQAGLGADGLKIN